MVDSLECLLKALKLKTKDGFITQNDGETLYMYGDYNIALPTLELLKGAKTIDRKGATKTNYLIFNPYKETNIIGNTYNPIKVVQQRIKQVCSQMTLITTVNLIELFGQNELQSKVGAPKLIDFISKHSSNINITKTTRDLFTKLMDAYEEPFGLMTTKKIVDGKIHRVSTLTCHMYVDMKAQIENDRVYINDVSLTKKQMQTFTELLKWVLNLDDNGKITVESGNEYTPSLNSLIELYYGVAENFNSIIKATKVVYDLTEDLIDLPLKLDEYLEASTVFRKDAMLTNDTVVTVDNAEQDEVVEKPTVTIILDENNQPINKEESLAKLMKEEDDEPVEKGDPIDNIALAAKRGALNRPSARDNVIYRNLRNPDVAEEKTNLKALLEEESYGDERMYRGIELPAERVMNMNVGGRGNRFTRTTNSYGSRTNELINRSRYYESGSRSTRSVTTYGGRTSQLYRSAYDNTPISRTGWKRTSYR